MMGIEAVDVVERQLAAYNAHDLEAFVACYAGDVRIFRLPTAGPAIEGRQALAEFYRTERFCLPRLRAEIVQRIVLGNKVLDHERIQGMADGRITEVVAVYEVRDRLIQTVWFHYPG